MPTLKEGDAIWASGEGKVRPGVVLRLYQRDNIDYAFIAFGSTQEGDPNAKPPPIVISPGQLGFSEMCLSKTTRYRSTFGSPVRVDDSSISVVGRCPDSVLMTIRGIYGFR